MSNREPLDAGAMSVALCTFNGARYLRAQLSSFAEQTRRLDELIVCDDGSTDDTLAILEKFAEDSEIPTTILRNETRLGVRANFERAIRHARGDFILLSDQDDVWERDKVAAIRAAFERHPSAMVTFTDARLIDASDALFEDRLWDRNGYRRRVQGAEAIVGALDPLRQDIATGATMALRKEALPWLLPVGATWPHDAWFAANAALRGALLAIERPLISYRLHADQVTGIAARRSPGDALRRLRASSRRPYDLHVEKLSELISHLRLHEPALYPTVRSAADHWSTRAGLGSRIMRLPTVLRELRSGRYSTYSRGWLSACWDLIRGV